jgi:beta-lactam-binding protein with PASTA domain
VTVPNVVGKPREGAAALLRNAGFDVETETVRSENPVDQVIRQDPQPNTKVDEGATVTLTVSGGPGTRSVPNVVGDKRAEAVKKLEDDGFKVDVQRESSDEVPAGRVIRTEPASPSVIEIGSTVRLVVSSGRERVEVPELVGLDRDEATSALSDAGLRVNIEEEDSDQPEGQVLRQDPANGTRVVVGTSVTIVVAREPQQSEVPDVTDQPEGNAVNTLRDAGFDVVVKDKTTDTIDEDGIVLSQSPTGGRQAKKGAKVTLTVGRFNPDLNPEPGSGDEQQSPEGTTTTP